jgi:hypothetical protein
MYVYICLQSEGDENKAWGVRCGRARKVRTNTCALTYRHTNFAYVDLRWREEVFNWRGRGGCVKKKILNTNFHNMKKKYRYTNFAYVHLKVEGWLCSDTRQIPQCFTTFSNGMALMIVRRWYAHGSLRERACVCVVCVCVCECICGKLLVACVRTDQVVVVVCVYVCVNKKIFVCRYAYAFKRVSMYECTHVCMYECTHVNGYMNVMSWTK